MGLRVSAAEPLMFGPVWPLPLAVVVRDRRLLVATLAVQALFIVHQLAPLLVPVQ